MHDTLLRHSTIRKLKLFRKLKTFIVLHLCVSAIGRDMHEVDLHVEGHHFAQLLDMSQINEMLHTDVDREAVVWWVELVNHRKA